MPVLINSVTTNLLNSGDTSLSGMFTGLLAVALGGAALGGAALGGAALGAVSLGFFFFSGDFILLMDLVPHITSVCLPGLISSASVCFQCQLENEPLESKKSKKSKTDETKQHSLEDWGGSKHRNQCIGLFTADAMSQCIAEIKEVEGEAARTGNPPNSHGIKRHSTFTLLFFSSLDELLSL